MNGDFETGNSIPWFVIDQTADVSLISVVRSDSAPNLPSHPSGGQYALKLEFLSSYTNPKAIDFGYTLTNTVAGRNYDISFDIAGCGDANGLWNVLVGTKTINSVVVQGDCNTWTTISNTFTAVGNDEIKIFVTSTQVLVTDQWYFDNFVVEEIEP